MSSSATTHARASGSMLSGVPAPAAYYKQYTDNFGTTFFNALQTVLDDFEEEVREKARSVWGDLGGYVTLEFDTTTSIISFTVPPEFAKEVEMLEYGTPNQAPKSVLRMAAIEAGQVIPIRLERALSAGTNA
jgi:hypothetical protein